MVIGAKDECQMLLPMFSVAPGGRLHLIAMFSSSNAEQHFGGRRRMVQSGRGASSSEGGDSVAPNSARTRVP